MRILIALTLLVCGIAGARAQTDSDGQHYFRDWLTACRLDGYCAAATIVKPADDAAQPPFVLHIGRQAQSTYWEVSLTVNAASVGAGSSIVARVDSKELTFVPPADVAAYGRANDFYFLGKKAQTLLDRLVPGKTVSFAFTTADAGKREAQFSLAGLAQALIWIDGQQHRIGSERVAEAPPVGLEPVTMPTASAASTKATPTDTETAAPAVAPPAPPALIAQIDADSDCAYRHLDPADITAHALPDGLSLYIVPCAADATNRVQKLYVGLGDTYVLAALPVVSPVTGVTASTRVFNARFDPNALVLTAGYRDPAARNCGSEAHWVWAAAPFHDGSSFRLLDYRERQDCTDSALPLPKVFPTPPATADRSP